MKIILIYSFLLLLTVSCAENKKVPEEKTSNERSRLAVFTLSEMHESSRPERIFLKNMPPPVKINLPLKKGGSYLYNNHKGKKISILLEPPERVYLPVLKNELGEACKNSDGNPFFMGDGGKSNFTVYTTENGLALDAVSCAAIDKMGNIWFGTYGGGVSRYDGKSFKTFTTSHGLANNGVWSILEDKSGNLWFGTDGGGVSKYDGKYFKTFSKKNGLTNNYVWSILEDKSGNLWFATNGGIAKFDGQRFTAYDTSAGLSHNHVLKIVEDRNGRIWCGTEGGGISCFENGYFTSIQNAEGFSGNNVWSILEDSKGNLWFGTDGGGVSCFNGNSFRLYSRKDGLGANTILSIAEDSKGNIWFGTEGGGVSCFDGKTFRTFTTEQGLANDNVLFIVEDKNSNLWFCTDGGGVSRYDGNAFTIFSGCHGLPANNVLSIQEDKSGNLWFATDGGGISKFDGKSFTNYSTEQGLANYTVLSLLCDTYGRLWAGTYDNGLSCFDGKSFTNYSVTQGLPNNAVLCICQDKKGNFWFGTNGGGVSRFDGESFTNFSRIHGLGNNYIWSILEDRYGNLWFGTNGGGVSRYNGKSFITFTVNEGLGNNSVWSMTEDNYGNIYFATEEGLSFLKHSVLMELDSLLDQNPNSVTLKNPEIFVNFTKADGLPDSYISQVMQFGSKIAAGTNSGIALFDLDTSLSILKNIEIYNVYSGYPVKDINVGQNCLFKDSKENLWAGTGSEKTALVKFNYSSLKFSNEKPVAVIQAVKLNEEDICWNILSKGGKQVRYQAEAAKIPEEIFIYGKILKQEEKDSIISQYRNVSFSSVTDFYPRPGNLVLPYKHNDISFEFAVIETSRPNLIKYSYILEGNEDNWSRPSERSSVRFNNLYEGYYTFKLKAQGANGIWGYPVSYSFRVLPPLYRSWWAYLLYFASLIAGMILFIKQRERNLLAEKSKLESMVEERTEELILKNMQVEEQKTYLEIEKQKSDKLLLNILPQEVAEELKTKGHADAKQFDEVTVLFTDFKDFTRLSEKMTPRELVEEIHAYFKEFDKIIDKYGIEKIKTIGDSYLCAGGLPVPNRTHAVDVVNAAIEIQAYTARRIEDKAAEGKEPFAVRIGIHTGSVVAGIVGIKKFAYDIWGDTVNTASRLENSSEAGKINISSATYKLVKDKFNCQYRGKIQTKGKGGIDMYYVEGKL